MSAARAGVPSAHRIEARMKGVVRSKIMSPFQSGRGAWATAKLKRRGG